jgi:hypothetical protein
MTQVTAGDEGDATPELCGSKGDRLPELPEAPFTRVIEAQNGRGSVPTGLGQEPKWNKRSVVEGLMEDFPARESGLPHFVFEISEQLHIIWQPKRNLRSAKGTKVPREPALVPETKSARLSGRMRGDKNQAIRSKGDQAGSNRLKACRRGGDGCAFTVPNPRNEDGSMWHKHCENDTTRARRTLRVHNWLLSRML